MRDPEEFAYQIVGDTVRFYLDWNEVVREIEEEDEYGGPVHFGFEEMDWYDREIFARAVAEHLSNVVVSLEIPES